VSQREGSDRGARVVYDPTEDILSINLGEPSEVPDAEIQGEGVTVRLRQGKVLAIRILNAHRLIHDALKGQR